ncbi:unnamed protein product [Hydatigera taeniaeformis]|uniref:DUF5727 domain-containing protein n=1 Tax=Hydatigena taeniaeformis TaxID=6205 RepID=A0A0R3WWT2_HYDTA|nr:unnamed protein product [Hydatigera taeniaeformis]
MLGGVVFLAVVAYCSGTDPVLWGSRIVATASGRSPTMHFRLPEQPVMMAFWKSGRISPITIVGGACYLDGSEEGRPCHISKESVNITIDDVLKFAYLHIRTATSLFSTAIFVPRCAFEEPEEDEVDLKASFPLSRFRKGHSHVELKFAVRGANGEYWVRVCAFVGALNRLFKCAYKTCSFS